VATHFLTSMASMQQRDQRTNPPTKPLRPPATEVIGNAFGCTPAFGRSYLPIQSTQTTCSACGGRTDDKPACTPSGAWLQHTCTLLDGVDPAKPQYQAGGDAEGWLSGTIAVRLPDCGDAKSGKPLITAYECEACSATGARDGCLKCSRQWQASCGFTRARLILGTCAQALAAVPLLGRWVAVYLGRQPALRERRFCCRECGRDCTAQSCGN
jgi:hypothetical protein